MLVKALIRAAEAQGGVGAILCKGDPLAGALAVILAERGVKCRFLERSLGPDGAYRWADPGGDAERDEAGFAALVARRQRADPDLWVVELDIASAERFADEMTAFG
ncbi:DUF1491 family protein [Sphingosinicella sp.]|uniref:DUF1491 family protein n=1 Tax=Sphingosinicella sp. TaxID=1917971 RepID=UPI0040378D5A